MALSITDRKTETTVTTYFKVAGLPTHSHKWPDGFLKEVDSYMKSIKQDQPWLANSDLQFTIEENPSSPTPEEVLAKIEEIANKYFGTSPE